MSNFIFAGLSSYSSTLFNHFKPIGFHFDQEIFCCHFFLLIFDRQSWLKSSDFAKISQIFVYFFDQYGLKRRCLDRNGLIEIFQSQAICLRFKFSAIQHLSVLTPLIAILFFFLKYILAQKTTILHYLIRCL